MFINQQGVQAATIDIYGWSFNSIRYGDMLASRKKPRIPETHKNQGHNFRWVFIQKINQHMGFQPDPLGWFSTFQLLMFKYGWWSIMMIWWLQDISTIFEKNIHLDGLRTQHKPWMLVFLAFHTTCDAAQGRDSLDFRLGMERTWLYYMLYHVIYHHGVSKQEKHYICFCYIITSI